MCGIINLIFPNAMLLHGIPYIPDSSLGCVRFAPLFVAALKGTLCHLCYNLANYIRLLLYVLPCLPSVFNGVALFVQHHILAGHITVHQILPVLIAMLFSGMLRE